MDVPRGLCAPRTLAAYVLPTTSYSCALSAFGARTASGINPYRIGRFSRGPVPNASKRQFGSANLVRRGPCPTRRLKAFKASHIWAAGGARVQARRSTDDVVGGLPPEKSRGLRGCPAQRQRTEVGRIRSCCQGWTGLDDCCEERGQVAPGGREGSGSTRQRLATRGPSSIQRTAPARG